MEIDPHTLAATIAAARRRMYRPTIMGVGLYRDKFVTIIEHESKGDVYQFPTGPIDHDVEHALRSVLNAAFSVPGQLVQNIRVLNAGDHSVPRLGRGGRGWWGKFLIGVAYTLPDEATLRPQGVRKVELVGRSTLSDRIRSVTRSKRELMEEAVSIFMRDSSISGMSARAAA
jgi:hypothetical protein